MLLLGLIIFFAWLFVADKVPYLVFNVHGLWLSNKLRSLVLLDGGSLEFKQYWNQLFGHLF